MASSLTIMTFAPTVRSRSHSRSSRSSVSCGATAAKTSSGGPSSEEKGLLEFIVGAIMKEDQILVETDPILQKVEDKTGGTTSGRKNTVAVPPKKSGGFGGFFAKK